MNEQQAIERLKQGDIEGLALLVETYQVQAVRTAMLITRDRAQAEDVVQSAFLRAYERIGQFDEQRPFKPWFLKSVVNAAIQAARGAQRNLSLDNHAGQDVSFEELLAQEGQKPEEQMEENERKQAIRQALDKLSPEQRAVVVMRYFLDMSEREIAEALKTPRGTIKWRLHKGRKRLNGLLQRLTVPVDGQEAEHE